MSTQDGPSSKGASLWRTVLNFFPRLLILHLSVAEIARTLVGCVRRSDEGSGNEGSGRFGNRSPLPRSLLFCCHCLGIERPRRLIEPLCDAHIGFLVERWHSRVNF